MPASARRAPAASTSASLIGDLTLIFLDEPTTGFDPGARRAAWETIRNPRGSARRSC